MFVAFILIQKPQKMMFQLLADKKELMELKIVAPLIIYSKSFPPVIIVGNVFFFETEIEESKTSSLLLNRLYFKSIFPPEHGTENLTL